MRGLNFALRSWGLALSGFCASCQFVIGNTSEGPALFVSPSSQTLAIQNTATFTASGGVPPYKFSIGGGSVNGSVDPKSGLYTAPASSGQDVVRVTDSIGTTTEATITVNPALTVSPATGTLGSGETLTFSVSGGVAPYAFSIASGTGSVTSAGVFSHPWSPGSGTVRVTDSYGNSVDATVSKAARVLQFGSSGAETGNDVASDSSGNIFVAGTTDGALDGNTNKGGSDAFLVKYDSAGHREWSKQIGTSSYDVGKSVAADGSGNVYVAGTTGGNLDGNSNAGSYDFFVSKYDSAGTRQWTQVIGSSGYESLAAISVDSIGSVYLAGYSAGGVDGNSNAGAYDLVLVKYDASGVKQWTRQLGTASSEYVGGVTVDSSGNAYVSGYTSGSLDGVANSGNSDLFLVKYNTSGVKQWTQLVGTSDYDYGYSAQVDGNDDIYVSGLTYNTSGINGTGSQGGILVKFNSSGVASWTKKIASSASDTVGSVGVDSSNHVYVSGSTYSALHGSNQGEVDVFLVKLDSSGTVQWTRQFGSSAYEWPQGLVVDASDQVFIAGYTDCHLEENENAGLDDFFLAKYSSAGDKQ